RVSLFEKLAQFITKGQVRAERYDDAVGRNPYRTAVAPRRPVALKQITHRRQMIGQQQIVMRSESDEPATRFPQRHIAVRVAEMRPLRQIEEPDPRVG